MKRCVSITFDVDPKDYNRAKDTPAGTVALVLAMLRGDTDIPDEVIIACEGVTRKAKVYR
jgi:hypothetical protein